MALTTENGVSGGKAEDAFLWASAYMQPAIMEPGFGGLCPSGTTKANLRFSSAYSVLRG